MRLHADSLQVQRDLRYTWFQVYTFQKVKLALRHLKRVPGDLLDSPQVKIASKTVKTRPRFEDSTARQAHQESLHTPNALVVHVNNPSVMIPKCGWKHGTGPLKYLVYTVPPRSEPILLRHASRLQRSKPLFLCRTCSTETLSSPTSFASCVCLDPSAFPKAS